MASQSNSAALSGITERSYFWLARVHSLFGLMPVGVFLCFHLAINSTILAGPDKYQAAVQKVHLLEKIGLLLPVEILFILLPLFFHAVLGVVILLRGSVNVHAYPFWGNIRYVIQRATGIIVFVFIVFHLWQMHWLGLPYGGAYFNVENASRSAAGAIQSSILSISLYVTGVIAAAFHLANGLWTASITWGLTIGPRSQRNWGYVCAGLGICLAFLGIAVAWTFATLQ